MLTIVVESSLIWDFSCFTLKDKIWIHIKDTGQRESSCVLTGQEPIICGIPTRPGSQVSDDHMTSFV